MKAVIVAGEASGDIYGGRLAASLVSRLPGLELAGMGGETMAASGVRLLYDSRDVSVVGVFEVASKLSHLRKAFSTLTGWIREEKPDFAILIDFPDFNFRLARFLKQQNISVFYFISPQIWAWRKGRIRFLKQHVDLMISILPFEKEMYETAGVPVKYIGHPLVEMVRQDLLQQPVFEKPKKPVLGLMPGSREVEVERHWPVLLKTAERIRDELDVHPILIRASSLRLHALQVPDWIQVITENRYAAMKACDLMLVASGTSTLESAILDVPMMIVYRVGGVSWQIGKVLVRVPYYGLVNWIAQEKVIPEYIQDRMNPELLAKDAVDLLTHESKLAEMRLALEKIVSKLGPPGAIERAVDAITARL